MVHLPQQLKEFFKKEEVNLGSIQELGGVHPARGVFSFRVHSKIKSYILKNCKEKREFDVYTKHESFFKEKKITIPEAYFSSNEDEECWIVLEDIPQSFPKERWRADAEQIEQLYQLHASSWGGRLQLEDPFAFNWREKELPFLPNKLLAPLNRIRMETDVLFQPLCVISGDPNPTNWAMRDNGELVLFDFERIGYGNPAIDLAITIPGLGSVDGALEYEIAEKYLSHWKTSFPYSVDDLTRQIQLAKLWTVVEFLTQNYKTMKKEDVDYFIKHLAGKIR